jgi:hypothetical protein
MTRACFSFVLLLSACGRDRLDAEPPSCFSDTECDDGDPCSQDRCSASGCLNILKRCPLSADLQPHDTVGGDLRMCELDAVDRRIAYVRFLPSHEEACPSNLGGGNIRSFRLGDKDIATHGYLGRSIGRAPSIDERGEVTWQEVRENGNCLAVIVNGIERFTNCGGGAKTFYQQFYGTAYRRGQIAFIASHGETLAPNKKVGLWTVGSTTDPKLVAVADNIISAPRIKIGLLGFSTLDESDPKFLYRQISHLYDITSAMIVWSSSKTPGGDRAWEMDFGGRFVAFNRRGSGAGIYLHDRTADRESRIGDGAAPRMNDDGTIVAWRTLGGVRVMRIGDDTSILIEGGLEAVIDGQELYVIVHLGFLADEIRVYTIPL